MTITEQGFDISHLNNVGVDRIGAAWIVHKATQGVTFTDDRYTARKAAAQAVAVLWGAYHFGTASDVQAQAAHFLSVAGRDGKTLLALDLENNPDTSPQSEGTMTLLQAAEFVHVIHDQAGVYPVIYTSQSVMISVYAHAVSTSGQALADEAVKSLQLCDLWVASTAIPPTMPTQWKTWRLQQYGQLEVNGVLLDADRANFETLEGLKAWWGMQSVSATLGTVDNPNVSGASAFNADTANMPADILIAITIDLQVAGVGLVPKEYAVRLHEIRVTPDVPPPLPTTIAMKTTTVLNVHTLPAIDSPHINPPIPDRTPVNIKPGTTPEPNTGTPRYIWVALANRAGFAALSETVAGVVKNYLIPA